MYFYLWKVLDHKNESIVQKAGRVGERDGLERALRKFCGVIGILIILIVVVILWLDTHAKIHQIVPFIYVQRVLLICLNNIL